MYKIKKKFPFTASAINKLQYIHSTLEQWWTCCAQNSLKMQKLPCRVQETSFQGRQMHFITCTTNNFWRTSIHVMFSQVLTQWSFFSICWMLLKWSFLPPWSSLSLPHFQFVEEALEENTLGCFCTECLLESEDWNSKLFHGWKRKLRRLEMLQILSEHEPLVKTASEVALSLLTHCYSPAADGQDEFLTPARKPVMRSRFTCLRSGHTVPCKSTTGFEVTHAMRCQSSDWETNWVTDTQNPNSFNFVQINVNIFW